MELPYRFPTQAQVIAEQARRFRQLPCAERVQAIFDHIGTGAVLFQHSPHSEFGRRFRDQQEALWQSRHKELFTRHGY